jgi:glycosyltransferase involved in cell wall biosynthesis
LQQSKLASRQFQRSVVHERLMTTIVNADAIAPPTEHAQLARSEALVLAVGRISHEKGFDLLIEAWRKIHYQLPGWELHIAGAGSEHAALTEQVLFDRSVTGERRSCGAIRGREWTYTSTGGRFRCRKNSAGASIASISR